MKTKTKKVFALTSLGVLLVLGVLVVIFLRDEPLSPETERALHYQVPPVAPEENAFIALAGLDAPAGSDFIRAGEEKVRQLAQGIAPPPVEASLTFHKARHDLKFCTNQPATNCL
ncbi:MAG: hypothetical protein LBS89_03685, partial [Zoogloeaceae bacterium]|nr:hypothetical protein [Zoogloeaceae bacterium]